MNSIRKTKYVKESFLQLKTELVFSNTMIIFRLQPGQDIGTNIIL